MNPYRDKKLVPAVKQSKKEAKTGKGKVMKTDKEMDNYFESL